MKIINNYTPVTYTNQKTKAFAKSSETNLLGEERPKNAQLKSLGRSALMMLTTFGVLAAFGKAENWRAPLTNAAAIGTWGGLADYCVGSDNVYKLDADEKLANASIISLLGFGMISGIKKFFPSDITKNGLENVKWNPLKSFAYGVTIAMMALGLFENIKGRKERRIINENFNYNQ